MLYPDIKTLIPHREPMLLIDEMTHWEEDSASCSVLIKTDSFLCDSQKVPSYVALEYIAQSIAAYSGYLHKNEEQEPSLGFLLGIRSFKTKRPHFFVGEKLEIKVKLTYYEGSLGSFAGTVSVDSEEIISASVTTFKPTKAQLEEIKEGML